MKIEEIKPRRKRLSGIVFDCEIDPKEYGAEVDPVGLLALDTELVELRGLKSGSLITDEELVSLIEESHIKRAKSRAMWYLSRGDMPKLKLIKKLSDSFPEYAAITAADRAEELGFINDLEYAKRRLSLIMEYKKTSLKMAKTMLLSEGVSREDVDAAAEGAEYNPTEAILTLVNRKYSNKLQDKKDFDRTVAALMRKGFSYSEIKEALNCFLSEQEYIED